MKTKKALNDETALFLKQALSSGLILREEGFVDSWLAIQTMLELARSAEGYRMFHWVTLKISQR